jgi:glycosyltransferase involved in cell wall biosynthesis
MSLPEVSICIPSYRDTVRLEKLLNSIREQDFKAYEVIITDDSPDDSVKHLIEANQDLDIKYFRNEIAKGSPENWNYCIGLATAPLIKLMHHDDYFYDSKSLGKFVQSASLNNDADYFYSGTFIVDSSTENGEIYDVDKHVLSRLPEQPAYLFHKNLIGAPTVGLFRKGLSLQFDSKLIWLVDIEYYIHVLQTKSVFHIPEPLVTTVISDSQLSSGLRNTFAHEVGEFLYCYHKLYDGFNSFNKRIMNFRLLILISNFNVNSEKQIRENGVQHSIPVWLKLYFLLSAINQRFAFGVFYRLFNFKPLK